MKAEKISVKAAWNKHFLSELKYSLTYHYNKNIKINNCLKLKLIFKSWNLGVLRKRFV